jgi:hypothetical protein
LFFGEFEIGTDDLSGGVWWVYDLVSFRGVVRVVKGNGGRGSSPEDGMVKEESRDGAGVTTGKSSEGLDEKEGAVAVKDVMVVCKAEDYAATPKASHLFGTRGKNRLVNYIFHISE